MAAVMRGLFGFMLMLFTATASLAADKAIIVLDASGSMWGQIDGKPKLEIARETLRTVLQSVPTELELGLMAYGHREKGSCEDIELVVPPAAGTAGAITSAADSMQFLGKTPLSAAVRQAADALRYTEDKSTVILITDGLETCNADPCAVGTELEKAGIDFTAHVVGFGLTAEEGKQVACLAENTGGKYFQADDAAGLKDALAEAVTPPPPAPAPEPPPEPAPPPPPEPEKPAFNFTPDVTLSEGGPLLAADAGNAWEIFKAKADGSRGDHVATEYGGAYKANLDPGDYVVVSRLGEASVEHKVTIRESEVAAPHFVLNAGTLIIRPLGNAGGDVVDGATVVIDHPGEHDAITYGLTNLVVPAGEQKVTVKIGAGSIMQTLYLEAGKTIQRDIVVGVGRVVANAFYVAGMKVEDQSLFIEILEAKKAIDGSRKSIAYGYGQDVGHDLPAGDYVVTAKIGAATGEALFSVKVGELTEASVVLNAGVLSIKATGGKFIEIFGAPDIQGNRKGFGNNYGETFQTTLPAGNYTIVVDRGDTGGGKKEAPAVVKAGERTEITVP